MHKSLHFSIMCIIYSYHINARYNAIVFDFFPFTFISAELRLQILSFLQLSEAHIC